MDEAFHDFVMDYESLSPLFQDYGSLILLRSLTKMFSIPGIRLGYVMANCEIIAKLASYQPHWSVNSVALEIGNLCLEEDSYIENTVQFITSEREKLFFFYEKHGFEVSLSRVNFYLLRDARAKRPVSTVCFFT